MIHPAVRHRADRLRRGRRARSARGRSPSRWADPGRSSWRWPRCGRSPGRPEADAPPEPAADPAAGCSRSPDRPSRRPNVRTGAFLAWASTSIMSPRSARRGAASEPDPVWAAALAELGGADGITIHLREDRRHIQDRDLRLLRQTVEVRLNLELAAEPAIVGAGPRGPPRPGHAGAGAARGADHRGGARRGGPERPDRRGREPAAGTPESRSRSSSIPSPTRSRRRLRLPLHAIELHTGRYANSPEGPARRPRAGRPEAGRGPDRRRRRWSSTPATA